MNNEPKLFLTDYNSYNCGSQFEFGHWVDLSDFNDADEFQEYITKHFKECDEKSPLGSPREEPMFADYEDMPDSLYSECMSTKSLEAIYSYMELEDRHKAAVEFLIQQGYDINSAIDKADDVYMQQIEGSRASFNEKYELYELMYNGEGFNINDYVSVDLDAFIRAEYTEFEDEAGNNYLIQDGSW